MTCASSSFSPLAGVGVAIAAIFLADEGLDVGVEDLGVVELDLDAPTADKMFITQGRGTDSALHYSLEGNNTMCLCLEDIIIT